MRAFLNNFFGSSSRSGTMATVFVAFLVSYGLSLAYTLKWNPEIKFWKSAAISKLSDVRELHDSIGSNQNVVFCYGGSTTSFSVDAGYATNELDFPMVNLGLHAGMGSEALTGFALSQLKPGDMLLVMLEPYLLVRDDMLTPLGRQFSFGMERPDWITWRSGEVSSVEFLKSLPDLRPGALNVFSMTGKAAMGRPIYRYNEDGIRDGGLLVTDVRNRFSGQTAASESLPVHGFELLKGIVESVEEKGATVAYCLPWELFVSEGLDQNRRRRVMYLKEIENIMPVVWEQELGMMTDPGMFGDTSMHLTEEAARDRTIRLVKALKNHLGQ